MKEIIECSRLSKGKNIPLNILIHTHTKGMTVMRRETKNKCHVLLFLHFFVRQTVVFWKIHTEHRTTVVHCSWLAGVPWTSPMKGMRV